MAIETIALASAPASAAGWTIRYWPDSGAPARTHAASGTFTTIGAAKAEADRLNRHYFTFGYFEAARAR